MAAVSLDVSRALYGGKGLTLEFMIPNRAIPGGWEVLLTLEKGFDRLAQEEEYKGDGSDVRFQVADVLNNVAPVLRRKELHLRFNGEVYAATTVPPVAFNEPQVYTINTKMRMARTNFDPSKGA